MPQENTRYSYELEGQNNFKIGQPNISRRLDDLDSTFTRKRLDHEIGKTKPLKYFPNQVDTYGRKNIYDGGAEELIKNKFGNNQGVINNYSRASSEYGDHVEGHQTSRSVDVGTATDNRYMGKLVDPVTIGCHKPVPKEHLMYKDRLERKIQLLRSTKVNRQGMMDAEYDRVIKQANRFHSDRNFLRENALATSADRNLNSGSRGTGYLGTGNLPGIGDKASYCPSPQSMAKRVKIDKDRLLQGYMGQRGTMNLKKGSELGAVASILLKASKDNNTKLNSTIN